MTLKVVAHPIRHQPCKFATQLFSNRRELGRLLHTLIEGDGF
jgi:hypothetical protein